MLFRSRSKSRFMHSLYLALLLLIILLPLYVIYYPPSPLIRYFSHRWKDVLFHVVLPSNKKLIALTIDDAPSHLTPEILQVLEENGAKATFFVIGAQARGGQESLLTKIVRAGHELGNHAMHDSPSRALTQPQLTDEIKQVDTLIRTAYASASVSEPPPRYFRPGSGFFSTRIRETAKAMGYQVVLGDIYPHDPQIRSSRVNARHVLGMLKPGGIVICHDRREWTLQMLREVLPRIRERGYGIVSLGELIAEGNAKVVADGGPKSGEG